MNKQFRDHIINLGIKANKLGTFVITVIVLLISQLVYICIAAVLNVETDTVGFLIAFIAPLIVATPMTYLFLRITRLVYEQKKEIELKNSMQNTLLSVLSHDVKGPFNNLDSILDFYFSGDLSNEKLNDLLKELQSQVRSNSNFLMSVLQWTKTQFDEFQINPVELDVKIILQKIVKAYKYEIEKKNIELHIDADIIAKADKDLVRIIYRNLILNAIKFSEKGGKVQLDVKIENNQLVSKITDYGTGMDDEKLAELFNSKLLDSSVGTYRETGTGLGLKLCKTFVEAQGGQIWAESKKGEGSVFYFTIPQ